MSDETTGIYQPEEVQGQPSPAPDNQPKEFVTPDQLKEEMSKLYQRIQKMTVKQENRVANKLSEWEKRVIEAGIPVTPEMKNSAQQRIAMDMLADEGEEAQPAPYPATAPTGNPITQRIVEETNAKMRALQKKYDYVLTENDPEFYEVPWSSSAPDDFLQAYEAKLKEAAPRRGRQLPQEEQPANPSARVPGPSGGAASGDLLAQYKREMDAAIARNASVEERQIIRAKHRQNGAPI